MRIRSLLVLVWSLALLDAAAFAQGGRAAPRVLPAFRSDAALAAYLRQLAARQPRPVRRPVSACKPRITVSRKGDAVRDGAIVHGQLTDLGGTPIDAAQLLAPPLKLTTITDAGGAYRLAIPAELLTNAVEVTLSARRIGYWGGDHAMTVRRGDSVRVDIRMCASVLHLSAVMTEGFERQDESVTNVQHGGVDEGGIVKLHGDHLVILRRGRLFTVAIGDDALRPLASVDAYAPGIDPDDAWYDEMLVSGNRVVVIGYSYERRGTEIGVFEIDADGGLRHRSTYHLRSDDYYSSRNYASRLIGDRLIFYSPLGLSPTGDPLAALPALRRWSPGATDTTFRRIGTARRVYRAAGQPDVFLGPALHSVTTCDLGSPEMRCEATIVVGPRSRNFYVSPDAVYLWLGGSPGTGAIPALNAMLYRIPIDGSAPSAIGVAGGPVDQFSFLQSDDGHLNVLVRDFTRGDAMWRPERTGGQGALVRIPLHRLGDGRETLEPSAYRELPILGDEVFHNRFVGAHLLYGTGNGWGRPTEVASTLVVLPWAGGEITRLDLPHGTDRIEALGSDAVVIGTDSVDLHFTAIALDAHPAVADRFTVPGASQGELRSHGFFFRADRPRGGVLGLPIRGPGRPGYEHLFDESASILFLRTTDRRFTRLGALDANAPGTAEDGCKTSCVDWYGNSRPLFVRGRILALLGYELVEARLVGGRIEETARITFAPRR